MLIHLLFSLMLYTAIVEKYSGDDFMLVVRVVLNTAPCQRYTSLIEGSALEIQKQKLSKINQYGNLSL